MNAACYRYSLTGAAYLVHLSCVKYSGIAAWCRCHACHLTTIHAHVAAGNDVVIQYNDEFDVQHLQPGWPARLVVKQSQ